MGVQIKAEINKGDDDLPQRFDQFPLLRLWNVLIFEIGQPVPPIEGQPRRVVLRIGGWLVLVFVGVSWWGWTGHGYSFLLGNTRHCGLLHECNSIIRRILGSIFSILFSGLHAMACEVGTSSLSLDQMLLRLVCGFELRRESGLAWL